MAIISEGWVPHSIHHWSSLLTPTLKTHYWEHHRQQAPTGCTMIEKTNDTTADISCEHPHFMVYSDWVGSFPIITSLAQPCSTCTPRIFFLQKAECIGEKSQGFVIATLRLDVQVTSPIRKAKKKNPEEGSIQLDLTVWIFVAGWFKCSNNPNFL